MNAERDPGRPGVTYLDHAATTPMLPEALEAMSAQLQALGNPSSLHASGRAARRVVEESRETVAQSMGARPSDVVFTAGGTEADNLAVKGLFWSRRQGDARRTRILAGAVEHHAVLDPLHWLESAEGATVEYLPVDHLGRVRVDEVRRRIEADPGSVAFVTLMWANNEVGTVQPVEQVAQLAHEYGVPVHTDAVQAVGQLPVDFAASGVDALTLSAHKIGGPIGAGALLVRREVQLVPVLHGGGQERDVRSGTLNVAAIAGMAAAVELAVKRQPEHAAESAALRDDLVAAVRAQVPDAILNGDPEPGLEHRLPCNAHLTFPGCEGDLLLMVLDAQGIECSTGSACSAGVPQASHVLLAMGCDDAHARASLRFSLGHVSTRGDVDHLAQAIGPAVERARAAGMTDRKETSA
ncbi:MAG: cysteine desulfurase [Actinomycetota bacterium]|nr:cysteine desulfurase [Actinomycetota bacterium]